MQAIIVRLELVPEIVAFDLADCSRTGARGSYWEQDQLISFQKVRSRERITAIARDTAAQLECTTAAQL